MNFRELATEIADFYEEDPSRWSQQYSALNAQGGETGARRENAVSWCISGAVDKIYGPLFCDQDAWMEMRSLMPGGSVVNFNDAPGRTVSDVIAQLRKIAATGKPKGGT